MTRFIAIEGLDASGKSTQTDLLAEAFRRDGAQVVIWSFPRYTSFFGRQIRELLDGTHATTAATLDPKSMALWFAMDRWRAVIEQNELESADVVLLNRWVLSNAVYQGARSGEQADEMFDWVLNLEFEMLQLPVPQRTILLDISVEESMRRATSRAAAQGSTPDVYEGATDLLAASRKLYQRAAAAGHGLLLNVDGKTPDEVHAEVWAGLSS